MNVSCPLSIQTLLFGSKLSFGRVLRGNLAIFTRSAVTPPNVNRFGRNLEHSEYIVGGWHWQILGAILAVATV